jgi:hypothetical protein
MVYTWWDALKDFLGAIGPILIAIPWLSDFYSKSRAGQLTGVKAQGKLATLKDALQKSLKEKIESPKIWDFMWTIVGLLFIAISFLIAFCRGLHDLLA